MPIRWSTSHPPTLLTRFGRKVPRAALNASKFYVSSLYFTVPTQICIISSSVAFYLAKHILPDSPAGLENPMERTSGRVNLLQRLVNS